LNPFDRTNAFVALGVAARELSYSQVIAHHLFTNAAYLANLSARLGISPPLAFTADDVETESALPGAGRLDILAQEPGGRVVIVETKVNAQVDPVQQAKYVTAGRAKYGEDTIFLAFKLGPAVRPATVPGFAMITSANVLADLPPGDFMGLRGMLEVFDAIEQDLRAEPMGPGRRMAGGTANDLDRFLFTGLRHSFFEFLFEALRAELGPFLRDHLIEPHFAITSSGGAFLQFYKDSWVNMEEGVQVHFELVGSEPTARIALHVETAPYPSKDGRHLTNKTAVAEHLQAELRGLAIPGLKECSTTIASLPISFENLVASARQFEETFLLCVPAIERALISAALVSR
jgi:hypothetical protein